MPVEAPKQSPQHGGGDRTNVEVEVADTRKTDLIGVRFVPMVGNKIIDLPLPSKNHIDTLGGRIIPQEIPRIPKYVKIYPPPDFVMIESKDDEYGGDWDPNSKQTTVKSVISNEKYLRDLSGRGEDPFGGDNPYV